ncbi:MAG: GGDEF domain-containing protein [Desulforegulaceae bacterium]|nr:GGDEF domain-containing protein [Desulforegulaceae bacterium]
MRTILKKILIIECLGFVSILVSLWMVEVFNLFHYLFGFEKTSINWAEIYFNSALIIIISIIVVSFTRKMHEKIEDIGMRDLLTGLFNRRYVHEYFEKVKEKKIKRFFSFILCDLDHFKKVNDTYGHDCGDYVLKETARIMKSKIRDGDLASRWGGEEFLLVLPDLEADSAFDVAERIRKELFDFEFSWGSEKFKISMSFGVAGNWLYDNHPYDIITIADEKLYEAKNTGRNKVVC